MTALVPDIAIRKDTEGEVLLAHWPLSALAFAVIFLGGAAFLYTSNIMADEHGRNIISGFLAFFGLFGVIGIFWRFRIRLDLHSRTYRARRGFWPVVRSWGGTFDDINAMVLNVKAVRDENRTRNVWSVCLDLKGLKRPASIYNTTVETDAYERLEHFAQKLRVKALDRTGLEEKETRWDELDKPVIEQAGARPESLPPPPRESSIRFTEGPGPPTILMPPAGFSPAWLILFAIALPFLAVGMITARALLFYPERVTGGGAAVVIALVFTLVGALAAFLAVAGMWGRNAVLSEQDRLLNTGVLFGRRLVTWKKVLKREVEGVDIKPVPRLGPKRLNVKRQFYELVVRSDRAVMRVGRTTRPEELGWLKDAVLYLLRR